MSRPEEPARGKGKPVFFRPPPNWEQMTEAEKYAWSLEVAEEIHRRAEEE